MSLLRCADSKHIIVPAESAVAATRRGLTLLELIVTLGVLAVLSTVAVRSLDPLANQARFEATQRTLNELRDATVGDPFAMQINGQPHVSGFIADTGSLPTDLDDLTTKPGGIIDHAIQTFDSDGDTIVDVTLTSGWNGPYLRSSAGKSSVLDGWGRAPLVDPDGGDFDFTSLGSDNDSSAPEDGYRADLTVTIPSAQYTSDVTFRLFDIDGTTGTRIDPSPTGLEQLGVRLYSVNGNGGTTAAIESVMLPIAATGTFEATRTAMTQGTAAARAILWTDTDSDDILDSGETIIRSSYVHYFTVIGSADVRLEMELR